MRNIPPPSHKKAREAWTQLTEEGKALYQRWFQPYKEREPLKVLLHDIQAYPDGKLLRQALAEGEHDARRGM